MHDLFLSSAARPHGSFRTPELPANSLIYKH